MTKPASSSLCLLRLKGTPLGITVLVIAGLVLLHAGYAAGESELKVGIYDFHPLCQGDSLNTSRGLFPEILKHVASEEKWHLTIVPAAFPECVQMLKSGQIDLLLAAPLTRELSREFDFSRETVISTWAQVFTSQKAEMGSFLDLAEKTIGVVRDDPHNQEIRSITRSFNIRCFFMEFNNYHAIFKALERGWIDAGIVDRIYGHLEEQNHAVEKTSLIFSPFELRFAVKKDKHDRILSSIDYHLQSLKKEPQSLYHNLITQAFGPTGQKELPPWVKWLPAAGGALFLFSAGIILLLRYQVKIKTAELLSKNKQLGKEIEERKLVEEALRASEDKYRTILDNMEEGYYEVDLGGRLTFFNDTFCRILGYDPGHLTGLHYKEYMDEENAQKAYLTFNQVFLTKRHGKGFDWKFINKEGDLRHVEASVFLILDKNGEATGFRGVVRDVTDREKNEIERKRLEQKLQHAEKMEVIGTLAGGVAHDLNNILSGLVSYPQLLLMELKENSPLRKSLEIIQHSGEKAAAIVQDLLTLARRGVAGKEVVNLNQIIKEYLQSPEFFKLRIHHPGVQLETRFDPDCLNILGSTVHLSKTVMNLVSNAAEAMPGGGRIVLATENKYIDRPILGYDDVEEGEYAVLSVSDSGTGIPPQEIRRIFEPFYTKKVMGKSGTGLGMTVVWGTVKDHHGHIDVHSAEGKGTSFTLYFPVTREEKNSRKPFSLEDYKGARETILVVDDVKEQREILGEMLGMLNYSFHCVSSGEEAVDYMKDHTADLIVLDMIMDPGMDGLDTYRKILEYHPGQKAVITSGFSETERVKEARRLGVKAYIRKPFLIESLGTAIHAELRG